MKPMSVDERLTDLAQRLEVLAGISQRAFALRDQKIAALNVRLNDVSARCDVLEDTDFYEKLELSAEEIEEEDEETAEEQASKIVYLEPSEQLAE